MKPRPQIRLAAALLTLGLVSLSGCVALDSSQPVSPAMVQRGVMSAAEIESHLRAGLPSNEIIAALERRGAEPVGSEDVEALRRAGASHALINTILQINQPARYVWVAPPRFSVFFGRSGWYWVDSFGWPVYPQPHAGWSPRHWGQPYPIYVPVKPSPKQQAEVDKTITTPVAPVKPSPRVVEKDTPVQIDTKADTKASDKPTSEKPVSERAKREGRQPPNEK